MSKTLEDAAIASIAKTDIVTYDSFLPQKCEDYCFYDAKEIQIFVNISGEDTFLLKCLTTDTIRNIKLKIEFVKGWEIWQQKLVFAGKLLQNENKLVDYGIQNNSNLYSSLKIPGGNNANALNLKGDCLDSKYNYDLTDMIDNGDIYIRGNFRYYPPFGCIRIGLNVLNKYSDTNWLGVARGRTISTAPIDNEWPVAYHGTEQHKFKPIVQDGYKDGKECNFGRGIYTAPNIEVAFRYAEKFHYNGNWYKAVIQNRVNPVELVTYTEEETNDGEYWLSKSISDVRPYAICIKPVL